MNIYEQLEKFIEAESYDIAQSVIDNNELTLGDLRKTSEIIPLVSEAIEELFADNYDGEALEIVEMVFNQNQENFFKTHMSFFIRILKSCIQDNEC